MSRPENRIRGMGVALSGRPHLKTETPGSPLYLETMALMLWVIQLRSKQHPGEKSPDLTKMRRAERELLQV